MDKLQKAIYALEILEDQAREDYLRIDKGKTVSKHDFKDLENLAKEALAELKEFMERLESEESIDKAYEEACKLVKSNKSVVTFECRGFSYTVRPHRLAAENQRLKEELEAQAAINAIKED